MAVLHSIASEDEQEPEQVRSPTIEHVESSSDELELLEAEEAAAEAAARAAEAKLRVLRARKNSSRSSRASARSTTAPAHERVGAQAPLRATTSAPELSSQAPADAAASSTSAAPASSTSPSARLEVPREQVAQSQPVILPESPPQGRLESWVAQLRRVPDQVLRHRAPGAVAVERAEQHEHRVEITTVDGASTC